MKHKGKMLGLVLLLVVGLAIAPPTGGTHEATNQQIITEKNIEIEFWDFTNEIPIRTTLELPEAQWSTIKNELQEAKDSTTSIEEQFARQLTIFQDHAILSIDVDVDTLKGRAFSRSIKLYENAIHRLISRDSILNNSIISAMCAINFELSNGTTFVLGLNSFINLIGFNIVSVHAGYSPTGIEAKGLTSKSTTPGEFFGFMFGFLGYWYGEQTGTGQYSSLTAAGFTFMTVWVPIPDIQ